MSAPDPDPTDCATYAPPRETEEDRILAWRLHQLLELGLPTSMAEKVAASHADLHEIEHLLQHGCAPDLAAEIVL
jgi:hypothetical protein